MVKKLRKSENPVSKQVKESAHEIWLAGLGAFAKAQEEGTKVFEALVKEGETIQARTREAAEQEVGKARGTAKVTWDKLEEVFEERVSHALQALNVPSADDLRELSQRVDELNQSVKQMATSKPAARRKAKTVAKASTKGDAGADAGADAETDTGAGTGGAA